jgi:hypothetical protein
VFPVGAQAAHHPLDGRDLHPGLAVRHRLEKQLQRRARELGYELKTVASPSAETEPTAAP